SKATGNLAQDAWFAALAIESGCDWITTDRDYARFPGLTWRAPL
ncbi:MAG: type II toxin-antitoxin system VapC family toxin, partial [Gammaproteobacteria bacterium]